MKTEQVANNLLSLHLYALLSSLREDRNDLEETKSNLDGCVKELCEFIIESYEGK